MPDTPAFHVAVFGPAAEYLDLVPEDDGVRCVFAQSGDGDPAALNPSPDYAILDLDFMGAGWTDALEALASRPRPPHVVAVTRDPSTDSAVDVLTSGAREYFVLPRDRDRIPESIARVREERSAERGSEPGRVTLPGFPDMVARCDAMREVLAVVRKVIESGANTVLIRGETGTGKELVARAIHYQSARSDQPFIEVNCTAIPETLLEAELFGYEAGAFTDAKTAKPGLLQLADGGTLFLDELGDMSLNLQGKLLRAIEEKRFRRVGGTEEIAVRMRIIAATSRDLDEAIAQGLFRSDLYYRLNVVSIELPPLRERDGDAELLAEYFADSHAEQYGKPRKPLADEARVFLRGYRWPGNVRELKNRIERAVLLSDGPVITLKDLSPAGRDRRDDECSAERLVIDLPLGGLPFDEYERRIIAHALERNEWNKSQTARELEISRPRLLRKIEKYGLEPAGSPA